MSSDSQWTKPKELNPFLKPFTFCSTALGSSICPKSAWRTSKPTRGTMVVCKSWIQNSDHIRIKLHALNLNEGRIGTLTNKLVTYSFSNWGMTKNSSIGDSSWADGSNSPEEVFCSKRGINTSYFVINYSLFSEDKNQN